MDENKQQPSQTPESTQTSQTEASSIDFSKFSL